jgi:hypothetical protein
LKSFRPKGEENQVGLSFWRVIAALGVLVIGVGFGVFESGFDRHSVSDEARAQDCSKPPLPH